MRAVVLAAGIALSLFGCNSILGMERARLDEGDAGPQGTGSAPSGAGGASVIMPTKGGGATISTDPYVKDCTAQSDPCQMCLQNNCDLTTCLKDTTCRSALLSYTLCLANNFCDNSSCTSRLTNSLENSTALPSSCIQTCADVCPSTQGALPTCNLYCSCMQSTCGDEFKSTLGGSFAACVAQCESNADTPSIPICRESHCEVASAHPNDRAMHCRHAVGMDGQCTGNARVCTDGYPTGFAGCNMGSECCSRSCSTTNVCVE